jgi:serine/threonine-protein kinase
MNCRACDTPLELDARFCGECGTRIALEPEESAAQGSGPTPASGPGPAPLVAQTATVTVASSSASAAPAERAPESGAQVTGTSTGTSATGAPAATTASAPAAVSLDAEPSSGPSRGEILAATSPSSVRVPGARDRARALDKTLLTAPPPEVAALLAQTAPGVSRGVVVASNQVSARRAARAPAKPVLPPTLLTERKSETHGSRDDMVGRTLNRRYLVGEKVGEGGFGAVFRGKQLATGRDVALKILHSSNLGDATIVARFRREAEACCRLRNPHTVVTYDFDQTEDGVLYLAMELLNGRSLHHLEKAENHLDPFRVLRIIDQVAEALGEAHQNGVVHRDMKPENIYIERRAGEDYVKVLDFGIAKIMSDDRAQPALTAVGQTLGTLEFMSPEQLRGQALDGRSDIYALGIVAYEMLTGDLPFGKAKAAVEIINFHLQKAPPLPSRMRPDLRIPHEVDEVILKMVAKSRDARYKDTAALRAHIAQVLKVADKHARGLEPYRLYGVIAAAALIVSGLVYFLSR